MSTIENNGGFSSAKGSAFRIQNSVLIIEETKFHNNTAHSGGAISFEWTSLAFCELIIRNSTFIGNKGIDEGGAIYYNYKRPTLDNVTFDSNEAIYGPDIASYPVKIRIRNNQSTQTTRLSNVGSGVKHDEVLYLMLLDYDDQVMVLNNVNQIIITSIDRNNSSVLGTNSALLRSGVATFDNIIFVSAPGEKGIKFKMNSKAIDSNKIFEMYDSSVSDSDIDTDFRFWMPGEAINSNVWIECSPGTYSLEWNATKWEQCPLNSVWLGKTKLSVNPGYWRRTHNSTFIAEWLFEDACEGGYYESETYPTKWAGGYSGNLWTEWLVDSEEKYQRVGDYECQKCPNPIINSIRVIGLGVIVLIFLMILIIINIRKTKESEISVLMRILTNYLQLITTSISFQTTYPASLTDIFYPVDKVGSSTETFLSFDCFASDYEIKGPFPSTLMLKMFLSALLPIILFSVVTVIWLALFLIKRKWILSLERYMVITFISILFLLHPKLAEQSLNFFQWVEIDKGVRKVSMDTSIDCYSHEHFKWLILIPLPIFLVWVIGFPLMALFLLFKNIHRGESNKVNRYFLILYQGLRKRVFYWEFINSLRKVLILVAFAILEDFQIMTAVIVLVITSRIQINLKPYKKESNNDLEMIAITAGILTLASGTIFMEEDSVGFLNFIVLIIVIIINAKFFLEWFYLFFLCCGERYPFFSKISSFIEVILFKSFNHEFKQVVKEGKLIKVKTKKFSRNNKSKHPEAIEGSTSKVLAEIQPPQNAIKR
jgi:hypothetical protein